MVDENEEELMKKLSDGHDMPDGVVPFHTLSQEPVAEEKENED